MLSSELLASRVASGLKATLLTESLCPSKVASLTPLIASQIMIVLSSDPLASRIPSGLTAMLVTEFSCRPKTPISLPLDTSHNLTD